MDAPQRSTIVGIDHVQLAMPVGGEDTARDFFVGLMDLVEVPKPEPLRSRGGCWFEQGSVKIHLGPDPDFTPAEKAHPALLVSELGALVERLNGAGYQVRDGATVNGVTQHFTNDPFGNRIELIAAMPDA